MSKVLDKSKLVEEFDIDVGFMTDITISIDDILYWLNEQKKLGVTRIKGSGNASWDGDIEYITLIPVQPTKPI